MPKAKELKVEEAIARQAEHDKLSLQQKINKARPGSKEHVRLLAKQAAEGPQAHG